MKNTNISNVVNNEQTANEKTISNNKKRNIILGTAASVVVVAIIVLILLLVGCNDNNDTATPDEVTTAPTVATADEIATLATLSNKDQAIVDNGLTVNEKGDIVDKNGKKIEPSEDGKVTIKDASGKEIKVDTDSVKTANTNKTYVETTNAIIQSANNSNNNSSGNSSSGSSSNKNNSSSNKNNSSSNKNNGSSNKNNSSNSNSNKSNSSNTNTNKNNNSSSGGSSSSGSSGNSGSSSNYTPPKQEETKHTHSWTDITKQVKVVDQEAYSYEETVYEQQEVAICKGCGCRVDRKVMTDSEHLSHMKQHMRAGIPSGYYGDVIDVAVGTETVNVPEKGHYETKIIKEAYDEKVLVREAGWY